MNFSFVLFLILFLFYFSTRINSVLIVGTDYSGSDLIVADGDILSGEFDNVGLFFVDELVTVSIDVDVIFKITCQNAIINGVIDGAGAGEPGAPASTSFSSDGLDGQGIGGGGAGIFDTVDLSGLIVSGGGGAGHASYGGNSSTPHIGLIDPGLGGISYGSTLDDTVLKGSGGGSAANHKINFQSYGGPGGAGGAAIEINTYQWLNVSGTIDASANDGLIGDFNGAISDFGVSAGGGGSGGTILLRGLLNINNAYISVEGGDGGDGIFENFAVGESGGGGGSAGYIKLFGSIFQNDMTTYNINGGVKGVSYPLNAVPQEFIDSQDGGEGIYVENIYTIDAIDDFVTVPATQPTLIDVLSNDFSVPANSIDSRSLQIISQSSGATLSVDSNTNKISYKSMKTFVGMSTQFTYQICRDDLVLICDTAIVYVTLTNQPPTFTSTPPTSPEILEGMLFQYTITTSDPEQQVPLTVSITQGTSWLSLTNINTNTGTATLRGTPPPNSEGFYTVILTVTDASSKKTTQQFNILVVDEYIAPVPSSTPTATTSPSASVTPVFLAPDVVQYYVSANPTPKINSMQTMTPSKSPTPLPQIEYFTIEEQEYNIEQVESIQINTNTNNNDAPIQIVSTNKQDNEIKIVGTVNIPETELQNNNVLIINTLLPIYYDEQIKSSILDFTLLDSSGNSITTFKEPVELCFDVEQDVLDSNKKKDKCKDTKDDKPCLSFLNEGQLWECIDDNLKQNEQNFLCGKTNHFSSFAVLLNGGGSKNNNNCDDEDNYFTKSVLWDSLTIVFVVVFIICLCIIFICLIDRVSFLNKLYRGKEGMRVKKLEQNKRLSRKQSTRNLNSNSSNESSASSMLQEGSLTGEYNA